MNYRFTRIWGYASALVGIVLIAVALLLAASALFALGPEDTARYSPATRAIGALLVMLVGLILGGTMIVAGQLACVLVEQRDLLERILTCLSTTREAPAR